MCPALAAARLAHLSDVAEAELDRGLAQEGAKGLKPLVQALQHNTEPYLQASAAITYDQMLVLGSSCLLT